MLHFTGGSSSSGSAARPGRSRTPPFAQGPEETPAGFERVPWSYLVPGCWPRTRAFLTVPPCGCGSGRGASLGQRGVEPWGGLGSGRLPDECPEVGGGLVLCPRACSRRRSGGALGVSRQRVGQIVRAIDRGRGCARWPAGRAGSPAPRGPPRPTSRRPVPGLRGAGAPDVPFAERLRSCRAAAGLRRGPSWPARATGLSGTTLKGYEDGTHPGPSGGTSCCLSGCWEWPPGGAGIRLPGADPPASAPSDPGRQVRGGSGSHSRTRTPSRWNGRPEYIVDTTRESSSSGTPFADVTCKEQPCILTPLFSSAPGARPSSSPAWPPASCTRGRRNPAAKKADGPSEAEQDAALRRQVPPGPRLQRRADARGRRDADRHRQGLADGAE